MNQLREKSAADTTIGPIGCRACDLYEICRLTGLLAYEAGRSRQSTGMLRTVPAGTSLYRAGESAHALFAVRQGLLKTVQVNAAGDEHVLALNIPGEVLGLEAISTGTYASDVIALQPVVCCELPLRTVREQGAHACEFVAAFVQLLSRAAVPRPNPARGAIRERVTRFLRDLGARLESRGLEGREFTLGLSRQELADHLDTRIETVSRTLRQLDREQAIRVRGKKVNLLALG